MLQCIQCPIQIAAVDRIATMAVFVWKMEQTTRVRARMGGPERTVHSSVGIVYDFININIPKS